MQRARNAIGGWIQSFNETGVRKALPQRRSLLAMVVSFLLGLGWAYSVSPTVYRDAAPAQLAQGWQNIWTQLLVERYRLAVNTAVTSPEFNDNLVRLLSAVDDPVAIVRSLGISDAGFLPLVERAQLTSMEAPPAPTLQGDVEPFVAGPAVMVLGAVALTLIYRLFLQPTVVAGARAMWQKRPGTVSMPSVSSHIRRRVTESVEGGDSEGGQPVLRQLAVFRSSSPDFDDSWEIQAEDKAFLGECGITTAETGLQEGAARVSALEAWLFDKDDPVRSMTTIFATGFIVNDPTARAQMETRGNIVPLEPGATAYLETNALRLRVKVIDVVWGALGASPSSSFLESATTEIAVWHKTGFAGGFAGSELTLPSLNPSQPTRPYAPETRPSGAPAPPMDVTRPVVPPQEYAPDESDDYRPVG